MKTNHDAGHDSEKLVARYLQECGFAILELNWKTARCEIDIVAKKDGRLYLIEVKSRQKSAQGYGYEYITKSKLKQMQYAAELYVQANRWSGEYQLSVASVDGGDVKFIENI